MKKYHWLNEDSRTFLKRGYLKEGQTPEDRYKEIAKHAEKILGIKGFAEKFEDYLSKGFYSLASPIISNFGNQKGLPVSCFNSYIPDSTADIFDKVGEVGIMSKMGGGTSGYFGDLRPRGSLIQNGEGGQSDGAVRFMELFDKTADVISQGSQRRGSFAAYLPVDHKDIEEFLLIREDGNPIQNMSIGVTITDDWMESMKSGNKDKRKIWGKIIKKRFESGYPYLFFTDTVNNSNPKCYKDKNIKVNASNLCSEITGVSDEENSFVCVLSSLNLLHWEEMIETDAVETLIYFLDAVNEDFIQKSEGLKYMETALNFAKKYRMLGSGVLGWHSYLQSKNIPFESLEAKLKNTQIFQEIQKRSHKASIDLAEKYGEPEGLKGFGMRNSHTNAVAPTTSSSFILGQISPSIEPLNSNYFVKKLAKGNFTYKNPFLLKLLEEKGKNTAKVWKSILTHGGSVQHLDILSETEKSVYKTFGEISQKEIVIQAASRQKFIDQAQSLNVMVPSSAKPKEVSDLMILAHEMGVKTLYYQRSSNPSQELSRNIMNCTSCEG